jgi:hypothetical protein
MLRKMYLVSPDYPGTTNNNNLNIKPPPSKEPRKPPTEKKRYSINKRPVLNKKTKTKKDTVKHAYDKWVKLHAKLHEADVERKRQINTLADFLKKVLPSSTFDLKVKSKFDAFHSGTQTELLPLRHRHQGNVTLFSRRPNERHPQVLKHTLFRPPLVTSYMKRLRLPLSK